MGNRKDKERELRELEALLAEKERRSGSSGVPEQRPPLNVSPYSPFSQERVAQVGTDLREGLGKAKESFGDAFSQVNPFSDQPFNPPAAVLNNAVGIKRVGEAVGGALLSPFAEQIPLVGAVGEGFDKLRKFGEGLIDFGFEAVKPITDAIDPARAEQIRKPAVELGGASAQGAAPLGVVKGLGAARKGLTPKALSMRDATAERVGGLMGMGAETKEIGRFRRAGQFMIDKDVSLKNQKAGIARARNIVSKLNDDLNKKIFEPASKSGKLYPAERYIEVLEEYKKGILESSVPDKAAIRAIDRHIQSATERALASDTPGFFSPTELQKMKVANYDITGKLFEKNLSPVDQVKKQGIMKQTRRIKKDLEELDPSVKGANWTQGAGLDVINALKRYRLAVLANDPALVSGTGATGAVSGNRAAGGLFAATELMRYRPFLVAWNRLKNKMASKVAGVGSEFTEEVGQFKSPKIKGLLPPALSSGESLPSGLGVRNQPPGGFTPPDALRVDTGFFVRDADGKIIGKRFLDFEGPENLLGGKKK